MSSNSTKSGTRVTVFSDVTQTQTIWFQLGILFVCLFSSVSHSFRAMVPSLTHGNWKLQNAQRCKRSVNVLDWWTVEGTPPSFVRWALVLQHFSFSEMPSRYNAYKDEYVQYIVMGHKLLLLSIKLHYLPLFLANTTPLTL